MYIVCSHHYVLYSKEGHMQLKPSGVQYFKFVTVLIWIIPRILYMYGKLALPTILWCHHEEFAVQINMWLTNVNIHILLANSKMKQKIKSLKARMYLALHDGLPNNMYFASGYMYKLTCFENKYAWNMLNFHTIFAELEVSEPNTCYIMMQALSGKASKLAVASTIPRGL